MASKKPLQLRSGIVACSEGTFAPVMIQALFFDGTAEPESTFNAYLSRETSAEIISESTACSTLFESSDSFTTAADIIWGTSFEFGCPDQFLLGTYEHELTPVRYQRLDDTTLTYSGSELTTVTKESGDTITLTYDVNGNLTTVDNVYTGYTKNLSYTSGQLTNVVTAKL